MTEQAVFKQEVVAVLDEWSRYDDKQGRAAHEILAELAAGTLEGLPPLVVLHALGYSVRDAALKLLYTSDLWDEDWAIAKQNELTLKYEVEKT